MRGKFNDLTGKVFGFWTVLSRVPGSTNGKIKWLCQCSCGTKRTVTGNKLFWGESKSCGCTRYAKGSESPAWRGGRAVKAGYIQIYKWGHSNADVKGYLSEHVFVMSEYLGRPLEEGETVHHKNGVRSDNSPNNLELWASRHPRGQRVSDLIIFAKELLIKYEPTALK